jgi:aspartyl-tRNA synthetase
MDWRYIDLRSPKSQLIFRVQTTVEEAMRNYWLRNGFIEIHSPKFVEGATESGSELFQLDYFGKRASLAQSPQFYKQMAMAAGFEKVFEIGPVFRANPSYTSRHDTEFTSVDMEMSWIDSHHDVMDIEEKWLQHALAAVHAVHGKKIKEQFGADLKVPSTPFPRITMEEAYAILESRGHDMPRRERGDLDPEGERMLYKHVLDKFGHEFVFVTDYPIGVRPFYHMRHDGNPELTKSFDLIWKGVEVTTGAQREHRLDRLVAQAEEKGVDTKAISHYLGFFKHGCPPHGGYGFGLTRMLMIMLDAPNVREVTYLYRGPNRLSP